MRRVGMNAVQTVLFPDLGGQAIQEFNHMTPEKLNLAGPDVDPEVERVLAVTTPQATSGDHQIYFAGEIVDVLLNARAWNESVNSTAGRAMWGKRRVQYFVGVPYSGEFAPSKFCAFLPIQRAASERSLQDPCRMSLQLYVTLDESESRFDGGIAQKHLTRRLGMKAEALDENHPLFAQFQHWLAGVNDLISVDPRGPVVLSPPEN